MPHLAAPALPRDTSVPDWREITGPSSSDGFNPSISVIVPFDDSRGHPDHLISWTSEQTLQGDHFEVVAAVGEALLPDLESELRRHLRPNDRLIACKEGHRFALLAAGARAAKAPLLFFTEDHCIADPDCLAAAMRHFKKTNEAGATVRWGYINNTDVAYMEQRQCEKDAPLMERGDHWNRIRIRGFAVRREVYDDAGGFEWPYSAFAEPLLSAKLHARGHSIGHVAESGVHHINTETLDEIQENAWAYSWSECAYCDSHDPAFCERYFLASSILGRDTCLPKELALWMSFALVRAIWRDRKLIRRGKWSLWGALNHAITGWIAIPVRSPLRLFLAWSRLWAARARFYFWRFHEERRVRAFGDFWQRVTWAARASYASQKPAAKRPLLLDLDPSLAVIESGFGFFPPERWTGHAFRWTRAAAVMFLRLKADDYELVIDTGGLRGRRLRFPLALYWNRRLIAHQDIHWRDGILSVKIGRHLCNERQSLQELTLAAAPLKRSARERRWLGLPIRSLGVRLQSEKPEDAPEEKLEQISDSAPAVALKAPEAAAKVSGDQRSTKSSSWAPRNIVVVNTADQGGGAEMIAWQLFKGCRSRGLTARMWVGHKTTDDPNVIHALDAQYGNGSSKFGSLRRLVKAINLRLGRDDFEFPENKRLTGACGGRPDLVHCHNLHGVISICAGSQDFRSARQSSSRCTIVGCLRVIAPTCTSAPGGRPAVGAALTSCDPPQYGAMQPHRIGPARPASSRSAGCTLPRQASGCSRRSSARCSLKAWSRPG